jgi:MoaA/NifB/PqqE/SkfB family radical SAM enzyme
MTRKCNLRCKFCYLDRDKYYHQNSEIDFEVFSQVIALIKELGYWEVFLTGGEPFLSENFSMFYQNLIQANFRIVIFTNGPPLLKG